MDSFLPKDDVVHESGSTPYSSTAFDALRAVVYDFADSRAAAHPKGFLEGWRGKLVCDDYSGYKGLFAEGVTEVGCLAHARRKFNDLWVNHKSPLAEEALQLFGKLYDVEREARELSSEQRQRMRQLQSRPIADKLREWLLLQRHQATDGTAMAKAIDYSLGRWPALIRFLDDGALPIGRVEKWRGGGRLGLSVAAPFVWRCPSSLAMTPFPLPAHRTGRADFPHPALFQGFRPSHSARRHDWATGGSVPRFRRGTGRSIGDTPFRVGPGVVPTRFASVARRTYRSSDRSVPRGLG